MKVLVVGGSGVIGRALIPALGAAGHEPLVLCRDIDQARAQMGPRIELIQGDLLDAEATTRSIVLARPDAIVHLATAIPHELKPRGIARQFAQTSRLRREGSSLLAAAARRAGAHKLIAQSVAFAYANQGEPVKDEDAPLNLSAPASFRPVVEAIVALEDAVIKSDGIVLRFGHLYGPGTSFARDGQTARQAERRQLPIVGQGGGLFSFLHVDDAASAIVAALRQRGPLVVNVVDDRPAAMGDWLALLARLTGGKAPRRVPVSLARVAVGKWGVEWTTQLRGASNERAKQRLGWTPRYPDWRDGFKAEHGGWAR